MKLSVKFYLKSPKANEDVPVIMHCLWHGSKSKIKHYTGERIHPKDWRTTKQRGKKGLDLNSRLDFAEEQAQELFVDFLKENDRAPSMDEFKDLLNVSLGKKKDKSKVELLDWITMQSEREQKEGKFCREILSKNFLCRKDLEGYCKARDRRTISFKSMDGNFYADYVAYLKERGISTNTIADKIKVLKKFLNSAELEGYPVNPKFKKTFIKRYEKIQHETLTEDELAQVLAVQEDSVRLKRVRDMFILGCMTGLRFQDWCSISPDRIDWDKMIIYMTPKKTKDKDIRVAIDGDLPLLRDVLHEYKQEDGGVFIHRLSNQKFNKYIKEFFVKHLDELPFMNRRARGRVEADTDEGNMRYDAISSHTGRRSFATNMYMRGIPHLSIMAVTGHKSLKTFENYVQIPNEVHIQLFREAYKKGNTPIMSVAK